MRKVLLFLTIITSLSGCKNINKNNIHNINIQDAYIINNDTTLAKDVEYVFLETSKNFLIGHISKILYQSNKFYILDKLISKAIFVFNKEGKFLYKIDKIGKGPGEYLELFDFDVDKYDNVYLYDNNSMKIIKYFADDEKFDEFKVGYRFEEFKIIDGQKIILYNVFDNGKINTVLGIYNIKNGKLTTIIPGRKLYDELSIPRLSSNLLCRSNNHLLFSPIFSDKIYKISAEKVTEIIRFDKSLIPPKEIINEIKKNYQIVYTSDKYITGIGNIYENSKCITMTIQKGLPYTCIISKNRGKKILNILFKNRYYIEGDIFIHGVANDKFISYIPTNKFMEDNWANEVKKLTLSENIKNKLLSLNLQSNPVIVLFNIKDF